MSEENNTPAEVTEEPVDVSGHNVVSKYRAMTDTDKDRMRAFWKKNHITPSDEKQQNQLFELVLAFIEKDDELVGYTLASVIQGAQKNLLYKLDFFFTLDHRNKELSQKAAAESYGILKAWEPKLLPQKPTGVMIIGPAPWAREIGWKLVNQPKKGQRPMLLKNFIEGTEPEVKIPQQAQAQQR